MMSDEEVEKKEARSDNSSRQSVVSSQVSVSGFQHFQDQLKLKTRGFLQWKKVALIATIVTLSLAVIALVITLIVRLTKSPEVEEEEGYRQKVYGESCDVSLTDDCRVDLDLQCDPDSHKCACPDPTAMFDTDIQKCTCPDKSYYFDRDYDLCVSNSLTPPTLTASPSGPLATGVTVELTCRSATVPRPMTLCRYGRYLDDLDVPQETFPHSLSPVAVTHVGVYTCAAGRAVKGDNAVVVSLAGKAGAAPTLEADPPEVLTGDDVTLTCGTVAVRNVNYVFYRDAVHILPYSKPCRPMKIHTRQTDTPDNVRVIHHVTLADRAVVYSCSYIDADRGVLSLPSGNVSLNISQSVSSTSVVQPSTAETSADIPPPASDSPPRTATSVSSSLHGSLTTGQLAGFLAGIAVLTGLLVTTLCYYIKSYHCASQENQHGDDNEEEDGTATSVLSISSSVGGSATSESSLFRNLKRLSSSVSSSSVSSKQ